MIEKFAERDFFHAEQLATQEIIQLEQHVRNRHENNEESSSESDHPELDENFEMNAELTGEPCFGAARNEHYLW